MYWPRTIDAMHADLPDPSLAGLANRSADRHIVPTWQVHRACVTCWCGPDRSVEYSNGARIWTHHARDEAGN